MDENKLIEKQKSSTIVYDGSFLKVWHDDIELPNGKSATRDYIRHVGAVAIVAMDENRNIVMERQFRYPLGRIISEIPAGKLNDKEEDPLSAAKRELEEETGITADRWQKIGTFVPTAAYSDEAIHLFWATGLHQGMQHMDEDEFLSVNWIPLDELTAQILEGTIIDGKTQAAIMIVRCLLLNREK